jgi:hypothetical protein
MLSRATAGLAAVIIVASLFVPWASVYIRDSRDTMGPVGLPILLTTAFNVYFVAFLVAASLLALASVFPAGVRSPLLWAALGLLAVAWSTAALTTLFPFVLGGSPLPGTGHVPSAGFVLTGIGVLLAVAALRTSKRWERA